MKKFISCLCIFALAAMLAACVSNSNTFSSSSGSSSDKPKAVSISSSSKIDRSKVNLIAHRGFSAEAPENTQASIRLAGQIGFYGCEFDVFPSSDGVWVVMHDDTIERMTNGSGKITDFTYDQLKQFKIDSGNNIDKYYPGLSICTLEQALDICKQYGLTPYIEIKQGYSDAIANLINMVKDKGMENKSVIISFDYPCLQDVRNLTKTIPLYYLVEDIKTEDIQKAKDLGNTGIDFQVNNRANTAEQVALVTNAELPACSWTVDTIKEAESLYAMGVYNITTNCITPK